MLAKRRRRGGFSANVQLLATVRWRPPLFDQNRAFLPHFFRISISQSVASTSLLTAKRRGFDAATMWPFSPFSSLLKPTSIFPESMIHVIVSP